jgi:hypothetical protein
MGGEDVSKVPLSAACNFMSLFKQPVIGGDVRNRLKTLQHNRSRDRGGGVNGKLKVGDNLKQIHPQVLAS